MNKWVYLAVGAIAVLAIAYYAIDEFGEVNITDTQQFQDEIIEEDKSDLGWDREIKKRKERDGNSLADELFQWPRVKPDRD